MVLRGIDAFTNQPVEVRFDSTITGVDPLIDTPAGSLPLLAPGWIDLQVNGFAGADYCDPHCPLEEIDRSLDVQFSTGVTRLLATVITGGEKEIVGSMRNLANAKEQLRHGPAIEGFHVEGPHISGEEGPRGAHPQRHVRPPDVNEFYRWQEAARGYIRLVTVSPEWPEAPHYIETLVREGVVMSIGHTKANSAQIDDAVRAGATKSTHLGNGAHGMLPRHPNYIWDQLADDRLAAGFIADGFHLSASFLKSAIRAKGLERSILVTDAVGPAECQPGFYRLGEVDVELLAEGRVVMKGGTRLAGSALRMDVAIGNTVRMAEVSLAQALTMASRNPARVARMPNRQRGLEPGERGDLVEFQFDERASKICVLRTWLSGEQVFAAAT
ncbi:MAG TPA: amidohydrolase family protein [Bryobacteraceae bacterium]|nr:amidohydrolase family protein [Bryobacteraceae bacterium]